MKLLASLRLGISTLLQRSQVNAEIEDEPVSYTHLDVYKRQGYT